MSKPIDMKKIKKIVQKYPKGNFNQDGRRRSSRMTQAPYLRKEFRTDEVITKPERPPNVECVASDSK